MNLPFYFLITPLILILCPFRIEAANEKVEKKILPSQSLETNKFQIKYEGLADSGAAFDILSILDEAYYDIGNDLGYFPEESIEVIIYTSKKHKLPSVMPDWASGLYDGSIHLKIGDIKRGRERLKYIVYQGYTQALLYQWVGKTPFWFNRGLAHYEAFSAGKYIWIAPSKCRQVSLAELNKPFYKFQEVKDALCVHKFCKDIVSYLIEQHGKFRLKDLLKQLSQGKDINAALLAVYNMDLSQLEKQWRLYESR